MQSVLVSKMWRERGNEEEEKKRKMRNEVTTIERTQIIEGADL